MRLFGIDAPESRIGSAGLSGREVAPHVRTLIKGEGHHDVYDGVVTGDGPGFKRIGTVKLRGCTS